jgi:hypothetical protein
MPVSRGATVPCVPVSGVPVSGVPVSGVISVVPSAWAWAPWPPWPQVTTVADAAVVTERAPAAAITMTATEPGNPPELASLPTCSPFGERPYEEAHTSLETSYQGR